MQESLASGEENSWPGRGPPRVSASALQCHPPTPCNSGNRTGVRGVSGGPMGKPARLEAGACRGSLQLLLVNARRCAPLAKAQLWPHPRRAPPLPSPAHPPGGGRARRRTWAQSSHQLWDQASAWLRLAQPRLQNGHHSAVASGEFVKIQNV